MSMQDNRIGLAGELRVMSELLLRGHNPAKSYLEDGADITLENGLRIEVKSAHRHKARRVTAYTFTCRGSLDSCNFIICWCMDDNCFYIIPSSIITAKGIGIQNTTLNAKHKYNSYKENWELLKRSS